MKKLFFILIICAALGLSPVFSQDLSPLNGDLSALLEGIGEETIPYLQQSAMLGEGIGRAHMGDGSPFFFAFTLGATFSPGILTFIDADNSNFELLNVYGLLSEIGGSEIGNVLDTFRTFMFYPQTRFAIGVQLPLRIEIIGMFSILPQFLTTGITGIKPIQESVPMLAGLTLNRMNAGIRVRKVLLGDTKGFPAISIGAGYTYSNFNAGLDLPIPSQDFSGYTLDISGALAISTSLHSVGLDVNISKKLAIFYPYLRLSGWYQWAEYTAAVNGFEATLDLPGDVDITTSDDIVTTLTIRDMAFLVEGGIEIAMGGFILTPSGSYKISTNSFDASLGFRLQAGTKPKTDAKAGAKKEAKQPTTKEK